MNTLIEGDLKDLFEVVQAIHELPFDKGLNRDVQISVLMIEEISLVK